MATLSAWVRSPSNLPVIATSLTDFCIRRSTAVAAAACNPLLADVDSDASLWSRRSCCLRALSESRALRQNLLGVPRRAVVAAAAAAVNWCWWRLQRNALMAGPIPNVYCAVLNRFCTTLICRTLSVTSFRWYVNGNNYFLRQIRAHTPRRACMRFSEKLACRSPY